jgi:hypothetical protein
MLGLKLKGQVDDDPALERYSREAITLLRLFRRPQSRASASLNG